MSPPVAGTHRLRSAYAKVRLRWSFRVRQQTPKSACWACKHARSWLNRTGEARPIFERLTRLGYRHPTFVKEVLQGSR